MRWYFSYPVLAAGLVFGVHTYLPQDHARPRHVAAAEPAPPVDAFDFVQVEMPDMSRLGSFSPDARLFAVADEAPPTSVLDYLARTLTSGAITPALFTPAVPQQPVTAPEWKSAVVLDVLADESSAPPQAQPTLAPRVSLTRDIQRELKRVGCYVGDVDGVWGGASKQAIVLFMDRVNASLPTQEPDVFMLSLLRAEDAAVCGTSCPAGQSLSGSGRCVPSTLHVQNDRGGERLQRIARADLTSATTAIDEEPDRSFEERTAAWAPVVKTKPTRRVSLEGRMAIGGPVPAPTPAVRPSALEAPALETGSLQRTAALEPQTAASVDIPREALGSDSSQEAAVVDVPAARTPVRPTSFDNDAVIERPARATASRAKAPQRAVQQQRRGGTNTYRHVQRLFQHPLGSL